MESNSEQTKAQENFKSAFKDFTHVASSSFGYFMENVEGRVKSTVKSVASEALAGVQELKRELDVAELVRKDPFPWLAGAAAVGGASVVVLRALAKGGSGIRWMVLFGEIGMSLIMAQRKKMQEAKKTDYFGG